MSAVTETIHGTAVAYQDKGLLLTGPSGSGKSSMALQLIGLGAELVADDRVILSHMGDQIEMSCPATISGMIEARGVGILNARPHERAFLAMVVDMGQIETERLPDLRNVQYFGIDIPLLRRIDGPHFPVTLLHLLAHGRSSR